MEMIRKLKYFRHYYIIFFIIGFNTFSVFSQVSTTEQVMNSLGVSEEQATNFLVFVSEQVDELQYCFSKIASVETTQNEKRKLINHLLENIFYPSATIQISSVNTNRIYSQSVDKYLTRLASLSDTMSYKSIDLYFDPDFLRLGSIEKLDNNGYTFNIGQKQYFRGCRNEFGCYMDMTYKDFAYIFEDGILKIKYVTVMETITTDNQQIDDVKKRHLDRFKN